MQKTNDNYDDLLLKARKQYAEELRTVLPGHHTAVMYSLEEIFTKEKLIPKPIETWDDLRKLKIHEPGEVVIGVDIDRASRDLRGGKQALACLKIAQLLPFYNGGIDEYCWHENDSETWVIEYNTDTHKYEVLRANDNFYNPLSFRNKEMAEKFVEKNVDLLDDYLGVQSYHDEED